MKKSLWLIFKYEIIVTIRRLGEIINPLLFSLLVACLFPLAISPESTVLQQLAPGVLWIIILLAILLTLDQLFKSDLQEGFLQQMLISSQSLPLIIFIKLSAQWLLNILPLILLAPVIASMLSLSSNAKIALVFSLLLGSPSLFFIGAIARSLTLAMSNNSLLLALLVLPLYIPILIFGASAVTMADQNLSFLPQLLWLGVILLITLPLAPLAIAAGLRIGEF